MLESELICLNIKYKLLICILIIYVSITGLLLLYYNYNKVNIFLRPNVSIEYYKGKYKKVAFDKNKNYNIYVDNLLTYTGKLALNDYGVFYQDTQLSDFIAIKGNAKVIPFEKENVDIDTAKELLKEMNIDKFNELTISDKIDIDYDNDNINETIYIFSDVFANEPQEQIFTIMYVIDDNKKDILYNEIFSEDITGCVGYMNNIIDINNDKKLELIYACTYFDKKGTKIGIYNLKNNNYKLASEIYEEAIK